MKTRVKDRVKDKPRPSGARRAAPSRRSGARRTEPAPVDAPPVEDDVIKPEMFTPMETGSPDRDEGRGPLGMEGEGDAQNDALAALEGLEPKEEDEA